MKIKTIEMWPQRNEEEIFQSIKNRFETRETQTRTKINQSIIRCTHLYAGRWSQAVRKCPCEHECTIDRYHDTSNFINNINVYVIRRVFIRLVVKDKQNIVSKTTSAECRLRYTLSRCTQPNTFDLQQNPTDDIRLSDQPVSRWFFYALLILVRSTLC